MSDLHATSDHPADRPGRSLRALTILGIAIAILSVGAMVWAQSRFAQSNGYSGEPPLDLAISQTIYSIAPGALTAGIVCVGLAIAASAVVATMRSPIGVGTPPAPDGPGIERPSGVPPVGESPTPPGVREGTPRTAAAVDPELFRRPRSASDPRP